MDPLILDPESFRHPSSCQTSQGEQALVLKEDGMAGVLQIQRDDGAATASR